MSLQEECVLSECEFCQNMFCEETAERRFFFVNAEGVVETLDKAARCTICTAFFCSDYCREMGDLSECLCCRHLLCRTCYGVPPQDGLDCAPLCQQCCAPLCHHCASQRVGGLCRSCLNAACVVRAMQGFDEIGNRGCECERCKRWCYFDEETDQCYLAALQPDAESRHLKNWSQCRHCGAFVCSEACAREEFSPCKQCEDSICPACSKSAWCPGPSEPTSTDSAPSALNQA